MLSEHPLFVRHSVLLSVTGGGRISTATEAPGRGGNISIQANGQDFSSFLLLGREGVEPTPEDALGGTESSEERKKRKLRQ